MNVDCGGDLGFHVRWNGPDVGERYWGARGSRMNQLKCAEIARSHIKSVGITRCKASAMVRISLHRAMERRWRGERCIEQKVRDAPACIAPWIVPDLVGARGLSSGGRRIAGAMDSGTAGVAGAAGTAVVAALQGRGEFGDSGREDSGGDCGR
jgi:hypothetical protein